VDKIRLIRKMGGLSDELMEGVNQPLKLYYDLE
jgi:hypothetical protein